MTASSLGPIASIAPVAPSASPQSSTHGNPPPPDADRSFARALDRAAGERKQGDKASADKTVDKAADKSARPDGPARSGDAKTTPATQAQAEAAAEAGPGDPADGLPPTPEPVVGPIATAAEARNPLHAPTLAPGSTPGAATAQGEASVDLTLLDAAADATAGKSALGTDGKLPAGAPASKAPGPNPTGADALALGAGKEHAPTAELPPPGMAGEAALRAAEGLSPAPSASGSAALPVAGGAAAAVSAQPTAPAGPPSAAAPVPADVQLHARPDQPGFHGALGAQLSILARNGVTEARLHLNPAELGPVWVQISVNGQAARIDMAAEHILTRQALEQSMPALASALRDSGLTLTGGGVFEQPNQPGEPGQPGGQHGGRRGSGPGGPAQPEPAALPAPRARGMVDLYA